MTNYTTLHQRYLTILEWEELPIETKRKMIEEIVGLLPGGGWHVKGATVDALSTLAESDYKKATGVVRGHLNRRQDTYYHLINNPILDAKEWFDYIMENSTTYLCTKTENAVDGFTHWSKMVDFKNRPESGCSNLLVSVTLTKKPIASGSANSTLNSPLDPNSIADKTSARDGLTVVSPYVPIAYFVNSGR